MTPSTGKKLGLIGLGVFGQLVAFHLRKHFEIIATDDVDRSDDAAKLDIAWGSTADVAACPYVILAVPVQSFPAVLDSARAHMQPGALVIDVASVKLATAIAMEQFLPDDVEILATHPMFGPQSARGGLSGHRIVLCPVRTRRLDEARDFLEAKLGLDVHVCDPETHDREIAQTQALAQFVGRALARMQKSDSPVRTPGYNQFREVAETVGDDSWELFSAIQNLNPFSAEMRAELLGHLDELQRRLSEETGAEADDEETSNAEGGG